MDVGDDTFVLPEKGGRPRGGIGLDGAIAGRIGCEVFARFFNTFTILQFVPLALPEPWAKRASNRFSPVPTASASGFWYSPPQKQDLHDLLSGPPALEIVWGDLSSYEYIFGCVTGVDHVLYVGAFISPEADKFPCAALTSTSVPW